MSCRAQGTGRPALWLARGALHAPALLSRGQDSRRDAPGPPGAAVLAEEARGWQPLQLESPGSSCGATAMCGLLRRTRCNGARPTPTLHTAGRERSARGAATRACPGPQACSLNHNSSHLAAPRRAVRGLQQPAYAVCGQSHGVLRVSACADGVAAARERAKGQAAAATSAPHLRRVRSPARPRSRLEREWSDSLRVVRVCCASSCTGVDRHGGGTKIP